MSNRASPSPATLKSSCASADVGLIDGTAELATEVRCDDRTNEDLIGMLMNPHTVAYGSRGGSFNVSCTWSCSSRGDYATNSPDS
jgi:hypothetical protein